MRLPLKKVATALNLPLSTVERWIRQGRIPIQQIGNDAVFSSAAVKRWADSHQLSFVLDHDNSIDESTPEIFDSLVSAMKRGKVFHQLGGNDREKALRSAVKRLDFLTDDIQNELYDKLLAREQLASTGIGNGIAIPHPRDPISQTPKSPVIATFFIEHPIHFNAIDDQPVSIFFLLISPTVKNHLHLLSRLSYCIRDKAFTMFLHTHPNANDLFSRIAGFEKQLDEP